MARRLSHWRKLAGAAWGPPTDPQFFGDLEVDAAMLVSYLEQVRRRTGVHLTVTHLVGKAVAYGLSAVPELRVRLARGREYDRESIDVFFIVTAGAGEELTGVKVEHADQKSAVDIARELTTRGTVLRQGVDAEFGRAKALLTWLPPRMLRYALRVGAWLTSDLNLDLRRLGMPRQAFGGAMITSVGMWGITHAYSPLARYYRVPVLVLVGAVRPRPVAVAGEVLVRPVLEITATFDHRYADGFHAARFGHAMHDYLAHPALYEPPLWGVADPEKAPAGAQKAAAGAQRRAGPEPLGRRRTVRAPPSDDGP